MLLNTFDGTDVENTRCIFLFDLRTGKNRSYLRLTENLTPGAGSRVDDAHSYREIINLKSLIRVMNQINIQIKPNYPCDGFYKLGLATRWWAINQHSRGDTQRVFGM